METDNIFVSSVMVEKVCLPPSDVHSQYRKILEDKLKHQKEGKCSKYGFIRPNSIEILKVSPGKTRMVSLNGDVVFDIQFKADVCNPVPGMIIKGRVSNMNRFGLLITCSAYVDGRSIPVIELIVTKQAIRIQNQVDLNSLTIGNEVFVEVLGKKFELNDNKISAFGRIVNGDDPIANSDEHKKPMNAIQENPALSGIDEDANLDDDAESITDEIEKEGEEDLDDDELGDEQLEGGDDDIDIGGEDEYVDDEDGFMMDGGDDDFELLESDIGDDDISSVKSVISDID
jgi:DNA-directed RNA polymerase subunit E'/Rpb7